MKKIKQYWKEILIVIFVLFSLNKCVQSCNRGSKLDKSTELVDSLMQIIDTQNTVISNLEKDTANYINQIRMFKDFDVKRDTQDSIHNADMKAQQAQTESLIKQNKQLMRR